MGECPLCGSTGLGDFAPNYVACSRCGTLAQLDPPSSPFGNEVYAHALDASERRWLSIVESLGPRRRLLDR